MPAEESDRFSASANCAFFLVVIGFTTISGYVAALFMLLRRDRKCFVCIDDDYLNPEQPDRWAIPEFPRH